MLEPAEVKRDKNGHWLHPDLNKDEYLDVSIEDIPEAEGMEFYRIGLPEEDWSQDDMTDISDWNPDPPDGDGWFPVVYTEDEEGPFVMFARPVTPSNLATEEMTPCPKCGDLTFAVACCSKCKGRLDMLFDTKPFDLPTAFDKGYEVARSQPLNMLIFCPSCGKQHIDQPEPDICKCGWRRAAHKKDGNGTVVPTVLTDGSIWCEKFEVAWNNPPHKSHKCHNCGLIFRIADVPTNGVLRIQTKGKNDTWWIATPEDLPHGHRKVKPDETIKENDLYWNGEAFVNVPHEREFVGLAGNVPHLIITSRS